MTFWFRQNSRRAPLGRVHPYSSPAFESFLFLSPIEFSSMLVITPTNLKRKNRHFVLFLIVQFVVFPYFADVSKTALWAPRVGFVPGGISRSTFSHGVWYGGYNTLHGCMLSEYKAHSPFSLLVGSSRVQSIRYVAQYNLQFFFFLHTRLYSPPDEINQMEKTKRTRFLQCGATRHMSKPDTFRVKGDLRACKIPL